jgi:Protein of unknown function (DUF1822)
MMSMIEITEWEIDLDSQLQRSAWQRSQPQPTPWSQWNTYVNLYSQDQLLQWFHTHDLPQARAAQSIDRSLTQWHQVNGFAIELDSVRLICIPSEAIDASELLVPQIWVDSPDRIGDYYMAVHLSADGTSLRLMGYTTHQKLKQDGEFDDRDRTYSIFQEQLTSDFNLLLLTYSHYTTEQTRASIESSIKSSVESSIESSIQSGVSAAIQSAVETAGRSITRLGDWFQGEIDNLWQSLEDELNHGLLPNLVPVPVRGTAMINEFVDTAQQVTRLKLLPFLAGDLRLVMQIRNASSALDRTVDRTLDETGIQIKIVVISDNQTITDDRLTDEVQIRLLSIDRTELDQTIASRTEIIRLEFSAEPGEMFMVEICCNGETRSEAFVI